MDAAGMARRAARRLKPGEAAALTGSDELLLVQELLRQTIAALGLAGKHSRLEMQEQLAAAKAALAGLQPRNAQEGLIGVQMISTHCAAMACLSRAADAETDESSAQAALRRAERLLAVSARQSDSLLRARTARRGDAAEPRRPALPYDAPSWMALLTTEAQAWLQAQAQGMLPAPEPAGAGE